MRAAAVGDSVLLGADVGSAAAPVLLTSPARARLANLLCVTKACSLH